MEGLSAGKGHGVTGNFHTGPSGSVKAGDDQSQIGVEKPFLQPRIESIVTGHYVRIRVAG